MVQQSEAERVSAPTVAPRLEVRGVSKIFPSPNGPVEALRDVDLVARDGEFVAIVGPSGCGKSTLLNVIAGLEQPTAGEVLLDGVPVADRLGRTAYMHQKDLLLPWRTVLDNAILGLEVQGVPKREARARAAALLERFGLAGFARSYPATLSGGMRQRAAFLRTVLTERPILLLDEPFGALDALTRAEMQEWLLDLWGDLRRTIVFITHDVEEAILLSDRVLVMSPRPGTVVLRRAVPLPRPRHYDAVTDPAFVALKADLLAALGLASGRIGGVR
ncbi:MAG: ABC transporter ATP-binding protein [Thermomicrobiaceae bacterium]|nr:ABC transporter ATP-binding protein [Thermomicrobiaceae bacterium]